MYEPFLMITTLVDDRARLDREIERRRAVLERLDAQSAPRRGWFARLRRTRSVPAGVAAAGDDPASAPRARTADGAAVAPAPPGVHGPDRSRSEPERGSGHVSAATMPVAPATAAGDSPADLLAAPVR
ncbi:hypothetical protein [Microbacterium sp. CIAB417]|uniref:hypothetical protein n=1 Tax=Microbacterium sp. CIAB417 TaxID=2860287 RepID=UPI001FAD4EAC|nr:hypothetical protein [Microbacterium sp. CIAB417]